jgi:chromosome partitioning protein
MRQITTVATMKGGSGKSTLASCLAVHWHLNGRRSTIVDADPQRSIARVAAREKALGGVTVVEDATENAWKTARDLSSTGPIIIDTPGFRSLATLACIAAADFLLVPVKASPLDIDRMLDTLNSLIEGPEGERRFFRCVIYAEAALWGATPSLIDQNGPAAREIAAIADEVDGIVGFRQAA